MGTTVGLGAGEVRGAKVGGGTVRSGEGGVLGELKVLHECWDIGRLAGGFEGILSGSLLA